MVRSTVAVAVILLGASAGAEEPAESSAAPRASARPNVILLMSDDQGWGDVGFRGHPKLKTPHLDRMAREGLRFERFYSAAPVCSPTRGSALTGRHPLRLGIPGANAGRMPDREVTLGEALGSLGYATGFFGKWHLGTLTTKVKDANRGGPGSERVYAPPWEHGFDVSFATESKVPTWDPLVVPAEGCHPRAGAKGLAPGSPYGTRFWTGPEIQATDNVRGDDSRVIVDRAVPFIEGAVAAGKPFLAVVWFHTPHLPVVAGGKYLELYSGLSTDEQHYFGAITAMDDQIGRLRRRLDELGVARNTMLWFCSDNGPENRTPGTTGGLRARKRSLYEGGVRVPGLLIWPERIRAPRVTTVPCGTSDFFPTIAAAVGFRGVPAESFDGVDLLPLIDGEISSRARSIPFRHGRWAALVGERYKLVRRPDRTYELYDLDADPSETDDLATTRAEELRERIASLERWERTLPPSR